MKDLLNFESKCSMTIVRNLGLVVAMTLSLAACKSETSQYEGEWESTTIKNFVMEIDFDKDGDQYLMTMTSTMNGAGGSSQMPVIIKDNGIYGVSPLGGDPMKMFWIKANGNLTSMAGDFKR